MQDKKVKKIILIIAMAALLISGILPSLSLLLR